ncbi:MAG TPA: peptidoglycan DD-metalloendopeptidase family protein [Rhizomicrobium sp.]|nr:peptidoglycan DD-metalloendopeptidase family protein [Rhizomicrobium sp.]
MIDRRLLLASGAAAALLPGRGAAQSDRPERLELNGTMKQGSLVVGKTLPGSAVTVDGTPVRVGPEGHFAFGFEYDQTRPSTVSATYPDGSRQSLPVTPIARQYQIQRINGLPPQEAHPTAPDIVERIGREHALVYAVRRTDSALTFFAEPFDWPAKGIISGVFGSQRVLDGVPSAPHFGVDIAGGEGAPIHAPASGTVLLAEQFFLEGGYTLLDHGHGVFTGYMHQSAQLVKAGEQVVRGQQIGNIGHTGRATGPHLHWQMNWFAVRLDPSLSAKTPAPEKT